MSDTPTAPAALTDLDGHVACAVVLLRGFTAVCGNVVVLLADEPTASRPTMRETIDGCRARTIDALRALHDFVASLNVDSDMLAAWPMFGNTLNGTRLSPAIVADVLWVHADAAIDLDRYATALVDTWVPTARQSIIKARLAAIAKRHDMPSFVGQDVAPNYKPPSGGRGGSVP